MSKQTDLINVTDAITVDGSNNVGIGTSSPTAKLDVRGAVRLGTTVPDVADGGRPIIYASDGTGAHTGHALVIQGRDGAGSEIDFVTGTTPTTRMNVGSGGDIRFYEDTGTTSKFFWDASDQELEITSTGVHGLHLRQQDDNTANSSRLFFDNATNIWTAYSTNGYFKLASNATIGTSSGTDRFVIDASGNVGIGTSLPRSSLDIDGGVDTHIRMQTNNTGASSSDGLLVGLDGSTNAIAYFWNYENAPVVFGTNNSERMRIDSSGNLLVGTTSAPNGTSVYGSGFVGEANGRMVLRCAGSSTSQLSVARFYNPNGQVGEIKTQSSSTLYVTSSDYRLKTDAQPLIGASARVQALNPVNFEWIADGTRVDGFLAHEAATVVPESVTGTKDAMRDEEYEVTPAVEATYDDDGNELTAAVDAVMGTQSVPDYQGIDQSKLVPLLTAALQEALTEISSLKTRVEALEAV